MTSVLGGAEAGARTDSVFYLFRPALSSPPRAGGAVRPRNGTAVAHISFTPARTPAAHLATEPPVPTRPPEQPTATSLGGTLMIRKLKSGEYRLYSRKADPRTRKRRNLGTFATRAAAEKHERAVQFFKHRG
jgi:hypothetical protein